MSVTEASSNPRTDYEGENKSSPDDPKSKPGNQNERAKPSRGKKMKPKMTAKDNGSETGNKKESNPGTIHTSGSKQQKKQSGGSIKSSARSEVKIENGSKNEKSPGSIKKAQTYAEAIKTGKPQQRNSNKLQILDATIQQLITCLQNIKETGVSSELHQGENGNNKRNAEKKFKGGRKQF